MICSNSITISGFGDVYPVTFEGRIISAILIIVGLMAIKDLYRVLEKSFLTSIKQIVHGTYIKKFIKDRIDRLEQLPTPEV